MSFTYQQIVRLIDPSTTQMPGMEASTLPAKRLRR
jgi:hypothetical protein